MATASTPPQGQQAQGQQQHEHHRFPESVEEAGALLGATITQYGLHHHQHQGGGGGVTASSSVSSSSSATLRAPPKGMHSSFAALETVRGLELLSRLHELRSLLRSSPQDQPLVAAASLLAVLMKLVGVSTAMAAAAASAAASSSSAATAGVGSTAPASASDGSRAAALAPPRVDTPPMTSTPLRKLWVDCVVLCHRLGEGLSGTARIHTTNFMRKMLALAGTNPRSAKAAGGVRIAALDVIAGLFEDPRLSWQLAPWTLEALQVCLRALRSAGNGEPSYRVAAVRTACATAVACRQASLRTRPLEGSDALVMKSAMEDKATAEAVKLLRQAVTDKFPEVRSAAANFASLLAPLLLQSSAQQEHGGAGPTLYLEDVMNLSLKLIDDESPVVSDGWAEALARCMTSAIQYCEQVRASTSEERNADAGDDAIPASQHRVSTSTSSSTSVIEFADSTSVRLGARKNAGWLHACSSLRNAVSVMVDVFVKAGGESGASRAGGTFSTGGRAVRLGMSLVLTKFLRLQSGLGSIGEDRAMTMKEAVVGVLEMVGDEMEKQLRAPSSPEASGGGLGPANPLFGTARNWSRADPVLVRMAACRVLRQGLAEVAAEPVQLALLQDLLEMIPSRESAAAASDSGSPKMTTAASRSSSPSSGNGGLNPHQLQVVLIELSHLLATTGEAAASKMDAVAARLRVCLAHSNHGVRHEAAIACAALAGSSPQHGRRLLRSAVDEIQMQHAELVTLASMAGEEGRGKKGSGDDQASPFGMFRRSQPSREKPTDASLPHQFAIHGQVLMVSMLLRDLTHLPGGLPANLLGMVLSVAEILVSFQFNEVVTKANPGAACACVRAGFGIVSGALATGPAGVAPHIKSVFSMWKKSGNSAKKGGGGANFEPRHDLYCLDGLLSSVVVFLKYCSELLLSIPEALSQITMLLEEILPLFLPSGRIGGIPPTTAPVVARLECAKASLLEAFAWLPSGSFPMAADAVFGMAAQHIRAAVETDVSCSLLHALVSKEDSILDSKTMSRVRGDGQVGGARDIEETVISLTGEVALHGEREAVLHFLGDGLPARRSDESEGEAFRGSYVLGMIVAGGDGKDDRPPTPLHEVGTWRQPILPSRSARVRLVDAAIQAFSATFGLKSGKEQQSAMDMLESLVPPLLAQLARTIGVNAALIEQDRRSKAKEDSAAVANITAVLLSCLQALPLHEATHNVPIGLGPPWMNKAKDLLLTLLPSQSNVVRRAAAEGLALLATLGVTEDAHFLQSTVLHSLDEVMQGNKPDGKPRAIALEPVSAARAGSLLTLACIQRTAHVVAQRQLARARGRVSSSPAATASDGDRPEKKEQRAAATTPGDELPVLQMMTRILPSVRCDGFFRDYFVVRTYALHSFAVLLTYSGRLERESLGDDDLQLLRKAIELVEDNFSSCWTAASTDADRGQEAEKMASEVSFLAVLLRLMAFLVPSLHHLSSETPDVARRFSQMATLVLESHGYHPVVFTEAMAVFEVLAAHQQLLPAPLKRVNFTENPVFSCIPFLLECVRPDRPAVFWRATWERGCPMSPMSLRAAVFTVRALSLSRISVTEWTDMKIVSFLAALLEAACGARYFVGAGMLRSVAAPRESELLFAGCLALEAEIFNVVPLLFFMERCLRNDGDDHDGKDDGLVRWILFARALLSATGGSAPPAPADGERAGSAIEYTRNGVIRSAVLRASSDASPVYETANPIRWQVKCLAAQLLTAALYEVDSPRMGAGSDDPQFSPRAANAVCSRLCREAERAGTKTLPPSLVVFHLEDLLSAACVSATATQDQSELRTLQEASMHLLTRLVSSFGTIPDPEQPGSCILDQYATTVVSAVRHALAAPDDEGGDSSPSDASLRLFFVGCEALQAIVEAGLARDPAVLKRLIRSALPTEDEIPFFRYNADGEYPSAPSPSPSPSMRQGDDAAAVAAAVGIQVNGRAALLVKIGKVWTSGRLLAGGDRATAGGGGRRPEHLDTVYGELVKDDVAMAAHSAAVALDGARLLLGSGLSLAGTPLPEDDARCGMIDCERGILYRNRADISEAVEAGLAETWSSCACMALGPLLSTVAATAKAVEEDDAARDRLEACMAWLGALVPFLFAGVRDAQAALKRGRQEDGKTVPWSRVVDAAQVEVDCLRGVVLLVKDGGGALCDPQWNADIENLVDQIRESVLMPVLKATTTKKGPGPDSRSSSGAAESAPDPVIVTEACQLIRELAAARSSPDGAIGRNDSVLLIAVLSPLRLLESGGEGLRFGDTGVEEVISTCLLAAASMIARCTSREALAKAMLQLVLKTALSSGKHLYPAKVKDAAKLLLRACLEHDCITLKQRRSIASTLARTGKWEAWAIVCTMDDGAAVSESLETVQRVLSDASDAECQLAALGNVHAVVHSAPIPSPLVGLVLHGVGGEVLGLLTDYGTAQVGEGARVHRKIACADAMKVVLIGYQQISAEAAAAGGGGSSDGEVAAFLSLVFEAFLAVLRFNGLPNHPSPSIEGDSALGRMVAQAILHIARTTPLPFKAAVAALGESSRDRALLEFAVRAEMGGYAVPGENREAPAKKRLDIAGFKKS